MPADRRAAHAGSPHGHAIRDGVSVWIAQPHLLISATLAGSSRSTRSALLTHGKIDALVITDRESTHTALSPLARRSISIS
jgi:hypothetical protein